MYLAFVCAKEDDEDCIADSHDTAIVMRRCTHCGDHAVAGYTCDCGHEDLDPADHLSGHGVGNCVTEKAVA